MTSWLIDWLQVTRLSLLLCTTWIHTSWTPMPWPWRLSGRSSRTMTVTRCSPLWDLEPNCPLMDGCHMSSPWWRLPFLISSLTNQLDRFLSRLFHAFYVQLQKSRPWNVFHIYFVYSNPRVCASSWNMTQLKCLIKLMYFFYYWLSLIITLDLDLAASLFDKWNWFPLCLFVFLLSRMETWKIRTAMGSKAS